MTLEVENYFKNKKKLASQLAMSRFGVEIKRILILTITAVN